MMKNHNKKRKTELASILGGSSCNQGSQLLDSSTTATANRNESVRENKDEEGNDSEEEWIDLMGNENTCRKRNSLDRREEDDDSDDVSLRVSARTKKNARQNTDCEVLNDVDADRKPCAVPDKPTKTFKTRSLRPLKSGDDSTACQVFKSISYGPTIKAFIDSPAFQRLHKLKQLGVADTTYKCATHTRFEHSLGVYHVATKLVENLRQKQSYLNISDKDVLCIGLAGLCHDLGHGPFSHIYDGPFLSRVRKDCKTEPNLLPPNAWTHEDASIMMLEYTLKEFGLEIDKYELDEPLKQIGDGIANDCFGVYSTNVPLPEEHILTSRDLIFIEECILGKPLDGNEIFIGRPSAEQKEFLYDIVSNRHNGLDVDKYDYFMRDASRTLLQELQFQKLINEAVVAKADCSKPEKCRLKYSYHNMIPASPSGFNFERNNQHLMICYPDKLVTEVAEFFKTRFNLHSRVYTHKASKGAEYMICEILSEANGYFKIRVKESKKNFEQRHNCDSRETLEFDISTAMRNPRAYLKLTDRIIDQIASSTDENLEKAQELIDRMECRDLYKRVSSLDHERESGSPYIQHCLESDTEDTIKQRLLDLAKQLREKTGITLETSDLIVERWHIHHGMKHQNPVQLVRFVKRMNLKLIDNATCVEDLPKAEAINVSHFDSYFPRNFEDKSIRLYCTCSEREDYEMANNKGSVIDMLFLQWITNLRACRKDSFGSYDDDDNSSGDDGGGDDGRPGQTKEFVEGANMLTQEDVF